MVTKCKYCKKQIVEAKTDENKIVWINTPDLPDDDKVLLIDRWREGDNTPLNYNPKKHIQHSTICGFMLADELGIKHDYFSKKK